VPTAGTGPRLACCRDRDDPGVTGRVEVRAYAELNDFLPPEQRGTTFSRPCLAHQTVKDLIEATGIPHTEVDLILVNGESVGFSHRPTAGDRLAVYPVFEAVDIAPIARVRPSPLRDPRFVVDVHLGPLARLLRLCGFDVSWSNDLDDDTIAELSEIQRRIVLTQDRGLLKRRRVTHGLFVRPQAPLGQVVEVLRRLDLADRMAPFTRCVRCGGVLAEVPKSDILDRLEPLTRAHHDRFQRCGSCGQIYWAGSHRDKLTDLIDQICAELGPRS
jgi:uncharacterized protein with PIN domain